MVRGEYATPVAVIVGAAVIVAAVALIWWLYQLWANPSTVAHLELLLSSVLCGERVEVHLRVRNPTGRELKLVAVKVEGLGEAKLRKPIRVEPGETVDLILVEGVNFTLTSGCVAGATYTIDLVYSSGYVQRIGVRATATP